VTKFDGGHKMNYILNLAACPRDHGGRAPMIPCNITVRITHRHLPIAQPKPKLKTWSKASMSALHATLILDTARKVVQI
jgi:hypothetical protein